MKIAYLINRYPAASHSFIRREIEALEAAGAEVVRYSVRAADAASLPDSRDQAEINKTSVILTAGMHRLLWCGLRIIIASPRRSLTSLKIAFAKSDWRLTTFIRRAAYFAEAATLAMRMRNERVVHLHAHFGTNSAMVARIASRLSTIPYSFTVHGPDEFDAPNQLDLHGKIADAAFCVAISSYGRSQLMRWSAFSDWGKIKVVRCGVDAHFLTDPELHPISDVPRLCAIARLSAQKGIPLLVEAASRLRHSGTRFHLTLVGDGEMRTEIEEMIEHNNLRDIVELIGWASSETVTAQLLRARAMVLPSFAEGLPVVIMEALALKRPVVVTAIAGTPELVDSSCGWLIPAGSVDALVKAMEEALHTSVDQLNAMGGIGRERVAEQHDSGRNGRQLYQLFQCHQRGRA